MRSVYRKCGKSAWVLLVALSFCAHSAYGQNISFVRSNSVEVGGFVGASYGGTSSGGITQNSEFRVMGGANITYAINKYILPYAEFTYFPGINREVNGTFSQSGNPFTLKYQIPVRDFHGGVHIRLPIFRENPIVPYVAFGIGALSNSSRTVNATYTDVSGTVTQQQVVSGDTEFAFNGGGGVRYYVGQRFGFRLEAKIYKPTGNFGNTFGKVEGGFFIQLR